MDKIKYSNLLNKYSKGKYWGMYISVKCYSLDKKMREELTFEQFCKYFAKDLKISQLNSKLIKK